MRIQTALRICLDAREQVFARPSHWEGSGEALDLACRLIPGKIHKVLSLHTQAVIGSEWKVLPDDLLHEDWKIVSMTELGKEVGRIDAPKHKKEVPEVKEDGTYEVKEGEKWFPAHPSQEQH